MDILSIDPSDLLDLQTQAVSLSKGILPNKYVGPITIKVPSMMLDSLAVVFKYGHQVLGHEATQEFVGELMTDVIAYALGFEQASLNWHKRHGPDQVVRHTQIPSLWGIFEAKGGTHGLSSKDSRYGRQMSKDWITGWLDEIVDNNSRSPDGKALAKAMRDKQEMLALVSRLDIRRQGTDGIAATFQLGFQIYTPPKGNAMKDWKGFQ